MQPLLSTGYNWSIASEVTWGYVWLLYTKESHTELDSGSRETERNILNQIPHNKHNPETDFRSNFTQNIHFLYQTEINTSRGRQQHNAHNSKCTETLLLGNMFYFIMKFRIRSDNFSAFFMKNTTRFSYKKLNTH